SSVAGATLSGAVSDGSGPSAPVGIATHSSASTIRAMPRVRGGRRNGTRSTDWCCPVTIRILRPSVPLGAWHSLRNDEEGEAYSPRPWGTTVLTEIGKGSKVVFVK